MSTTTVGLAGIWGLVVSIIVLVIDRRKSPPSEIKYLLTLGLAMLPFFVFFVIGIWMHGVTDVTRDLETPFGEAVGKGMDSVAGALTTHGAMKLSARARSGAGARPKPTQQGG